MANWLSKILSSTPVKTGTTKQVPAPIKNNSLPSKTYGTSEPTQLPNASIVYGIAASILFVVALIFVFRGAWLTGLLVLLPAACFLGFALHFLKHPNS